MTDLKSPRPVPLALSRPDTELKAAISIIPVERCLDAWRQLPHQGSVALPPLQGLVAVVEQHIPGGDSDDLQCIRQPQCNAP